LQAVAGDDVSAEAFRFGDARRILVQDHLVRALRVTYVGELGFEIHAPNLALPDVYDAIMEAGAKFGIKPCGYRAIESLRLEKGYRAWGADITPNDSPIEAGLGWAVKLKAETDFIGRAALVEASNKPQKKMMVGFTTDREDVVLVGRETILRDGKFAGYLTSGGYGYTIEKPVGYGYVRDAGGVTADYVKAGTYELVVAQERVKARAHLAPLYDPENLKVKG